MESTVLPPSFDAPALGSNATGDLGNFVIAANKTVYFRSGLSQIFRAAPGQVPVLFAGNGTTAYNGDNVPADPVACEGSRTITLEPGAAFNFDEVAGNGTT